LLLRQVGNVLLTLRGHLADEMREINFCRVRLGELLRMLEQPPEATESATPVLGKQLYPDGCNDLKEAVAHFENQLGPEALGQLDVNMEVMLKKQFTALVNVCLTQGNVLKNVETAMLRTAEAFVAERLGTLDVAEMFVRQHDENDETVDTLTGFFEDAAPHLPSDRRGGCAELCVLAAPSGSAGERFRALVAYALPDITWETADGDEELLLYREWTNLPLAELPQLGSLAQDAYRQMTSAEHFTPHCRTDINFSER